MNKKYLKNIIGLTLIEILIGMVITSIMMAAIYTSYNVVNKSYSKVAEKAKISKSSRDLVSMLMRDIRMAGFRYYAGTYEIEKFRQDTAAGGCTPGMDLPKTSYLVFDNGFISQEDSHNPIVIRKNNRFDENGSLTMGNAGECCDLIEIVYEDYDQNKPKQPFKKYRITYFGQKTDEDTFTRDNTNAEVTIDRYGIYKKIESWKQLRVSDTDCDFPDQGEWVEKNNADDFCPECTPKDNPILIRDHIVDMEFIPFDENGIVLKNSSGQFPAPELSDMRDKLFDIRGVDVRLTLRSKEEFFKKQNTRVVTGLSNTDATNTDKYLRDSVIVSVNTRNLGGESF